MGQTCCTQNNDPNRDEHEGRPPTQDHHRHFQHRALAQEDQQDMSGYANLTADLGDAPRLATIVDALTDLNCGSEGAKYYGESKERSYDDGTSKWFREGLGRQIWADGSEYHGHWNDDAQNGHGKFTDADGTVYVGHWKNGRKNGEGKQTWPDGSEYLGNWEDNVITGHGNYKMPDGSIYVGDWANNKFHGKGMQQWPDGRKYDGHYKEGIKDGEGLFTWPTGKQYDGNWRDGRQHGEGSFVTSAGVVRRGLWANGERTRWLGKAFEPSQLKSCVTEQ